MCLSKKAVVVVNEAKNIHGKCTGTVGIMKPEAAIFATAKKACFMLVLAVIERSCSGLEVPSKRP
jgi:hypothetical protein